MNLLGETSATIFDKISDFLNYITTTAGIVYWAIGALALMLLAFVSLLILTKKSYEVTLLRSVDKINKYLLAKPFINEDNLVEFNLKMKKVPKVLRTNWQMYMLNREDSPSAYINVSTCIDKPLRTSSIEKNMKNFTTFTILLVALSLLVGFGAIGSASLATTQVIFQALIVPCALLFFYAMFQFIMNAWKNAIYFDLYDTFPLFERNLNKAVSTLPAFVDYEILFTKKEIKDGIPVLQQYLEKRALIEQEELEKARLNAVACEEYDFQELGIDGSLVLERAMKECETFLTSKRRLQMECDQIETEKESYKKNYETITKEYQRKLQASRENLESLKTQQENSTNRIESNYIRKQQGDEIKKQQQIEKESDEATAKYKEEQASLQEEINKRKEEIEGKRKFVEQAMMLEFKHYANVLYKKLASLAANSSNEKLEKLVQENNDLKTLIEDMQGFSSEATQPEMTSTVQANDIAPDNLFQMSQSDIENTAQENHEILEKKDEEIKQAEEQEKEEAKIKAEQQANETAEALKQAGEELNAAVENADNDTDNNADGIATDTTSTDDVDGGKTMDISFDEIEKPEIAEDNVQPEPIVETPVVEEPVVEPIVMEEPVVEPVAEEPTVEPIVEPETPIEEPFVEPVEEPVVEAPVAEPVVEESVVEEQVEEEPVIEDELAALQKQIDAESDNLVKQKQELNEEIDKTISKLPVEEVEEPDEVEEEEEEIEEDEEEEEEKPAARRAVSRRPAARRSNASAKTGVRKKPAKARERSGGKKESSSAIDAINAEMQNLLQSVKK